MRPIISAVALFALACAQASSTRVATPEDRFVRSQEIAFLPDSGPVLRGQKAPNYPPIREEGTVPSVSVIVAYVVDTAGLVEVPTVSFLESPPRSPWDIIPDGFRVSVCDYLRDARYRPAKVGGRIQRALVIQAFVFSLTTDRLAPDLAPHVNAMREMSRAEAFEWLGGLPHCPPHRADSY